jgi:hypothetical protein
VRVCGFKGCRAAGAARRRWWSRGGTNPEAEAGLGGPRGACCIGPAAVKAGTAGTGGLFTIVDGVIGPRTLGPPLHVYHAEDECLYVIAGHLLVQAGGSGRTWARAVSPGCPGSSRTPSLMGSDSPVHILGVIVSGGVGEMFAERAAYLTQPQGPPDPERPRAPGPPRPPGRPADRRSDGRSRA